MLNKNALFLMALLLASGLYAQKPTPVVVVSALGKVEYRTADGALKLKPKAGSLLQDNGTLGVKDAGRALLYTDGQFQEIVGAADKKVAAVFPQKSDMTSQNFDATFGRYIESALGLAAVNFNKGTFWAAMTEPKKNGDGWATALEATGDPAQAESDTRKKTRSGWGTITSATGDPAQVESDTRKKTRSGWGNITSATGDPAQAESDTRKKTRSGWGSGGSAIKGLLPFGYVQATSTSFSWYKPEGVGGCRLDLFDENNKVIYSVQTDKNTTLIDLSKLDLQEGDLYTWRVASTTDGNIKAAPLTFSVGSPEEMKVPAKRASKTTINANYSEVRGLMEAVALEQGEWYYEADQAYARLLKANADNNLVRMMYAAFLTRYNMESLTDFH
jgi:hypothetical protein